MLWPFAFAHQDQVKTDALQIIAKPPLFEKISRGAGQSLPLFQAHHTINLDSVAPQFDFDNDQHAVLTGDNVNLAIGGADIAAQKPKTL